MDINDKIWTDTVEADLNILNHFDHSCVYLDHEGELISFPAPEFNSSGNIMNENNYGLLKSNNDE